MDNEKKQVTYNSSITGETQVTFDIQQYMNNRAMFIGLMCNEDGYEEPFGDVTVNLSVAAPNYCGYLNVNDMPDIEKFITDNDLGEFTGFTQRSGFCEYPLYLFNVDKLRELCPDGMDKYEARLLDIRENVRGAIKTTDTDIAKTALLAKGFREAGQTAANAFRTFADKPEVDYSQKEQKHPLTKAVLTPMKAVRKLLVSMELHLDASIDKLDNLAMNVQIDKEKRVENTKSEKQNVPDRAEAEPERVNAEIVYTPMVAEAHEYQYNADAFEARGGADVKVGTAEKVSKVREDKAR